MRLSVCNHVTWDPLAFLLTTKASAKRFFSRWPASSREGTTSEAPFPGSRARGYATFRTPACAHAPDVLSLLSAHHTVGSSAGSTAAAPARRRGRVSSPALVAATHQAARALDTPAAGAPSILSALLAAALLTHRDQPRSMSSSVARSRRSLWKGKRAPPLFTSAVHGARAVARWAARGRCFCVPRPLHRLRATMRSPQRSRSRTGFGSVGGRQL